MNAPYTSLRPRRQHWWWWALMGLVAIVAIVVSASGPPTDGVSDARLFSISARLKCLQCVGESVAGSQAPLAVEFHEEIRSHMARGDTDDEILNYFAESYPSDVLLVPPSSGVGSLVWIIPIVALAAVTLGLVHAFRRWSVRRVPDDEDDPAEAALVEQAMRERQTSGGDDVEP